MIIAIPSEAPGGLRAPLAPHFGHCAAFTLVEVVDGEVQSVQILPNQGHVQGGCMAPVMLLKEKGVEVLIAGGIGGRPLAGFQQVGIQVFYSEEETVVGEAVKRLLAGTARVFGPAQACGGGEGQCGGH